MSTIIFTAGAKGGTGKSAAIRFLVTYLREQGFNPLLLDMDDENHTLSRFFPEAQRVEIKKLSSNDVLVKTVLEGEELVIADLKAGVGRGTLDWWLGLPFDKLSDIKFVCLASITSSPDSVQSFFNWAAALKNQVTYLICKNEKDGDICPDYEKSAEGIRFHESAENLHEVTIPLLEEYMPELERLNLTISEVIEANGQTKTSTGKEISLDLSCILVRARLEQYQERIYNQLTPILNLLKE